MTAWKSTNKIGVAIYNYSVSDHHEPCRHLPLFIGDIVQIKDECKNWFHGYSLTVSKSDDNGNHQKLRYGIFPKNYILLQNYDSTSGNYTFEQETIFTLREWMKVCKEIFINGDIDKYFCIKDIILVIVSKYQILKSGKLTSTEMKKLKTEILDKIDIGNKHLDLDLNICNSDGFVINPFETSIMDYYELHWEKAQKLKTFFRNSNDSTKSKTDLEVKYSSYHSQNGYETFNLNNHNNCYNFCVTLSNFICVIKQDMIIYMAIYDATNYKFITENYIVKWDKTGFVREIEKINNLRVVFTDFSANELFQNNRKLYLVSQVIRVGTMHIDNERSRRATHTSLKANIEELKRPCGIAVYDLNDVINHPYNNDEKKEIFVPLVQYSEKDSLDSLLRKVVRDPKDAKEFCKTQGFIISIRIIDSFKMQLLDRYRLYYAQYPSYVARKIGFRDIILPEDVRNDLYVILASGEFHKGSKKSERNIEVTVKVIDENGNQLNNSLSVDSHNAMDSLYRSVVYYHEDKPKWMETIKILLPIEKFTVAHLKFTFKHRSSNENKDKNEKPFALAYIRLMNKDGTTLENSEYRPFVYKVDPKKFNDNDKSYLLLPSSEKDMFRSDFQSSLDIPSIDSKQKQKQSSLYVYSPRDIFTIWVVVCSTKLAQNYKIFSLLNWKEKKDSLNDILTNVQKLDGGEIMKFLHDVLDALFEIWMDHSTPESYDRQIFDSLVYIIKHLMQEKFIHFQEILNDYIEKHFSATLIHTKLVENFKYYIENPELNRSYQTVTSMEFIFKFITRSRSLYAILNNNRNKTEFEAELDDLFDLFTKLMETSNDINVSGENVIKVKLGILKYFPKIIENVLTIYDEKKLTPRIIKLISGISLTDLNVQQLACIHEIVESELFCNYHESRRKLLPVINIHLHQALLMVMDENLLHNEKLDKCLNIISDALQILVNKNVHTIKYDIFDFVQILLQPMIETCLSIQQKRSESAFKFKLWSIIIALLYQMTDYHFNEFFNKLKNNREFEHFLRDLLKIFHHATSFIYPSDWSDMNITQNVVILKAMNRVINYTKENIHFYEYNLELWNQIFFTAINFITQKSLHLETFSIRKRKRIESVHKDMRVEMVVLIRSLWYNLANHKSQFIPSLIGPLLEVALIPVLPIRKDAIVIFFDMFLCFEESSIFRNEMLTQMDVLITSGKGDQDFQKLLAHIFLESSENHEDDIKELFEKFVSEISEQIEKLLIYRNVVKNDDNYETLMSCIIELLDFYDRIDRRELYIRYLYKLYDLHIKYENYNEAAYTLVRHSILLEWSDKQLEELLKSEKYSIHNSHRELKEKLYFDIIENFNKGQLWEAGIVYCKELIQQYENEIYDYVKLSKLFEKMASFYKLIISSVRIEPEYFYVTYYGKSYPIFFRNKSFIYRGKSYERLFEFTKRLQNQFPKAKLLDKLDVPKSEVQNSDGQFLSIYRVDPKISDHVKNKFLRTLVDERIIKYYQYNEINEFTFSRKMIKDNNERPASNEFAAMWIERSEYKTAFALPGILCRAEITNKVTYQLNPLKNAIDTMEKMNEKTRMIIYRYLLDEDNTNPLHNLLMHIKGIVSSDVQGGVSKYEEAFFDESQQNDYEQDDLNKLKCLIADQIPLLDLAIKIADQKQKQNILNQSMDGLYQYIAESFEKMREDIEQKYGKSQLPFDMKKIIENHYKMQKLANTTQVSQTPISETSNSMDGTMTLTKRSLFGRSNTSTTNTLTNTLRFRKKDSRRLNCDSSSSSVYASNANISHSQWYTDHKKSTGNLCYLSDSVSQSDQQNQSSPNPSTNENTNQQKRLSSRPSSGHFSNSRASIQSQFSLFYPSTSSMSLEDDQEEIPPPLPDKKMSLDMTSKKTLSSDAPRTRTKSDLKS